MESWSNQILCQASLKSLEWGLDLVKQCDVCCPVYRWMQTIAEDDRFVFFQNHPQNSFPLAKSWVCHLCKYIPSNCIFDSSPHSPQFQMHASVQIGAFFVVMFRLVVLTFDILWPWNWEVYRCTLRLRSFFLRSTFPGNSFQSWRKGSGNKQTWSNEGIVSDGFMLVSDSLSGQFWGTCLLLLLWWKDLRGTDPKKGFLRITEMKNDPSHPWLAGLPKLRQEGPALMGRCFDSSAPLKMRWDFKNSQSKGLATFWNKALRKGQCPWTCIQYLFSYWRLYG